MKIIEKAKGMVLNIKTYWAKPKEGEYVSYKEFKNFIIGAGAQNAAVKVASQLSFSAGCLFVGAVYGLKMMDFVMLGIVTMLLNYLFQPITMILNDNLGAPPKKTMRNIHLANAAFTVAGVLCFFVPQELFESFMPALPQVVGTKFLVQVLTSYYYVFVLRTFSKKFGKYRSWVIAGLLPNILSLCVLVMFPYNKLVYHERFWVMHLFFALWSCFGSCYGQVNNMENVISPNTEERTKIMSFGSFIHGLIPSIYGILFPVLAGLTGGMTDIKTYKYIIPIMVVIVAPFTLFMVFGVKDRVVQAQGHRPQIDMKKGFKEVLRNKYLWILNSSDWVATLGAGAISIVNMLVIYSMRKDWVLGVMAAILGTAWTPGMLLAPFLIRKFGKKRIILFSRYFSVISGLLVVAGVYLNSLIIVVALTYITQVLSSAASITKAAMTADVWDYQQYMSGERLDGCMGIFGYISSPISTFGAMLIPFIYGLVGFTSDWNILYDPTLRNSILIISIVIGSILGIIGIIPLHFYDLTEKRHGQIIRELQHRVDEIEHLQTDKTTDAVTVQEG